MIPIPNIPTDNLYKFMFVFGILLVGMGYYTSYKASDLKIRNITMADSATFRFGHNLNLIEALTDKNQSNVSSALEKFERAVPEDLKRYAINHDSLAVDKHVKRAKVMLDSIKEVSNTTYKQLSMYLQEVKDRSDISKRAFNLLDSKATLLEKWGYFAVIFGSILSGLGGYLWWYLHQRFQDELLRLEYDRQIKSIEPENVKTNRGRIAKKTSEPLES